jgi:hypothetical protein
MEAMQDRLPAVYIWAPDAATQPEQHEKMRSLREHIPFIQQTLQPHGVQEAHIAPEDVNPFDISLHLISPITHLNKETRAFLGSIHDETGLLATLGNIKDRQAHMDRMKGEGFEPIEIHRGKPATEQGGPAR